MNNNTDVQTYTTVILQQVTKEMHRLLINTQTYFAVLFKLFI